MKFQSTNPVLSLPALSNRETHYAPLADDRGAIIGGVGVVHSTKPNDSSATYQRLISHLENSPLAVIEWDSDFRVSRWSESAEALFGWRADEVLSKHVNEWQVRLLRGRGRRREPLRFGSEKA